MANEEKNAMQNQVPTENQESELKLDDARRVKVLSPSMMVFKRFMRNKLAIAGLVIIVSMFLFAFVGPFFAQYAVDQKFTHQVSEFGSYATAVFNGELRFVGAEGSVPSGVQSAVALALADCKEGNAYKLEKGQQIEFKSGNDTYGLTVINPDPVKPTVVITKSAVIASAMRGTVGTYDEALVDAELLAAIENYLSTGSKETSFEHNGLTVSVAGDKVSTTFSMLSDEPVGIASFGIYTALLGEKAKLQADIAFFDAVNAAIEEKAASVSYNGAEYTLAADASGVTTVSSASGEALFTVFRDYRTMNVTVVTGEGEEAVETETPFEQTLTDKEGFYALVEETIAAKGAAFTYEEQSYTVSYDNADPTVANANAEPCVIVSNSFDPIESKYDKLHQECAFRIAAETAIAEGQNSFTYENETFKIVTGENDATVQNEAGSDIVLISDIAYGAEEVGTELTVDFVLKLQEAMRSGSKSFYFVDQYGEETGAAIEVVNSNYYVRTEQETTLLLTKAAPSKEHLLGTDVSGMDVMTRLMYGGRISLIVGFIVIFFELVIGVVVGGISGFFGKWVDTALMRFVDLFNAIPFYPIVIIFGSLMDELRMGGWARIMMLMVIIGIMGWTGIARVVRGQILSLREQDFMVATEATGIRTSRRIFRHLVPNVMPLLIVNATMGLGSVILTEATLGYLGLGVKYPMASWGSIVNQATDMQVMTTAWWIWIPAGLLILLTVLGFNFVGDGLRDAFDPKMKR